MGAIDEALAKNQTNQPYLVGNQMTIADISWGAWLLKAVYNDLCPFQKELRDDMVTNWPRVNNWA